MHKEIRLSSGVNIANKSYDGSPHELGAFFIYSVCKAFLNLLNVYLFSNGKITIISL